MMDTLLSIVQTINSYLSDYILIIMLVGTGLFFTIRTRFVQVRCFAEGIRKLFGSFSLNGKKHEHGMSSFQALTTAIAAQVGTGNIVGACGAILIGGPGAIFWMWVAAFLGMATIYAEAVLAQKTRKTNPDGSISGGPAFYILTAFKNKFGKFLAGFFSLATIIALGFFGSMVQSNSIAQSCNTAFGIPTWLIGILIAAMSVFIFIGGVKRLAAVTEKLVPVMALLYIVGCGALLIARIEYIPETFYMIFYYGINPSAIIGGSIGYALKVAISQGVKRGLFSNEAGMGSTPHAHAMANVKDPHEQGVMAMIGVFVDTFIVVTLTGLVVVSTLYAGDGVMMQGAVDGIENTNMAQLAFGTVFGQTFGNAFIAICLIFFAYSTIIGWNFFGRLNVVRLFGEKANLPYSVIAIIFIFIGSCLSNDLVWELADMFNQLMVIPNVIGLLALSGIVIASARAVKHKWNGVKLEEKQ